MPSPQRLAEIARILAGIVDELADEGGAKPLPETWTPRQQDLDMGRKRFPNVDVEHEAALFRDHYTASGKCLLNWDAAFRSWLRRAAKEFGRAAITPLSRAERVRTDNRRRIDDTLAQLAEMADPPARRRNTG